MVSDMDWNRCPLSSQSAQIVTCLNVGKACRAMASRCKLLKDGDLPLDEWRFGPKSKESPYSPCHRHHREAQEGGCPEHDSMHW